MTDMRAYNEELMAEFRANGGKVTGRFADAPLLLLTTIGAKSGQPRVAPLVYTTDGDRIVIIASKGGSPSHPDWYLNLVANPEVEVDLGRDRFRARATVVAGAERRRLYDQQAALRPAFAEYEKKTTREIPVVALTRLD